MYLEVGDRTPGDSAFYPDDDLRATLNAQGIWEFEHKDGRKYSGTKNNLTHSSPPFLSGSIKIFPQYLCNTYLSFMKSKTTRPGKRCSMTLQQAARIQESVSIRSSSMNMIPIRSFIFQLELHSTMRKSFFRIAASSADKARRWRQGA